MSPDTDHVASQGTDTPSQNMETSPAADNGAARGIDAFELFQPRFIERSASLAEYPTVERPTLPPSNSLNFDLDPSPFFSDDSDVASDDEMDDVQSSAGSTFSIPIAPSANRLHAASECLPTKPSLPPRRSSISISTPSLDLPKDLADRAPEVPILPGMTQSDHMMQLIYGLGRTCPDQRDPVEEFRSFNFCHRPQPMAIASDARSDASDESEDHKQVSSFQIQS